MLPSTTPRTWLTLAALALLLACGGCKERTQSQVPDASASGDAGTTGTRAHQDEDALAMPVPLEEDRDGGWEVIPLPGVTVDLPIVTHLLPLAGEIDLANRYPFAVLVTVSFPDEHQGFCSGTLISRHLVLTAGHCVCQPLRATSGSGSPQSVIDSSACAKTATVATTHYGPFEDTKEKVYLRRATYDGVVRQHPALRVLLDAEGHVVSSDADLAMIVLEGPFEKQFRPIPLADRDVQLNESIVIVGSGYDETARAYDGERRSSTNKIIELPPSNGGRLRIQQPGGHHYREDSGGPCLREGPGGAVLVGVSARNLGEGEAITSTYPYRDWLRAEIQRAETRQPKHPR